MPNAAGAITTHDIRRMRELRDLDFTNTQIARVMGCNRHAVYRHIGLSKRSEMLTDQQRLLRSRLKGRAHRYAIFVESAGRHGLPLLVPPSPF